MIIHRLGIVSIVLMVAGMGLAQPPITREIVLNASIRDAAGLPMTGIAVAIRNDAELKLKPRHVFFDSAGESTTTIEIPAGASYLTLQLVPAVREPIGDPQNAEIMRRFREFQNATAFSARYRVPLAADQQEYSIALDAAPAITIRGKLKGSDGLPISGSISTRNSWSSAGVRLPGDGRFSLGGIAIGQTNELVVHGEGMFTQLIQLAPEQTQADIDLGDITLHPISGAAKGRLQPPPESQPRSGASRMFTLVSENVETVLTVIVDNSDGRPRTPWLEPSQGWLPPGRYYVIPNSIGFGGDDTGWLLLDLIRGGKADEHPELISFVAAANEEAAVTLDPEDINAKIKAAAQAEGMLSE